MHERDLLIWMAGFFDGEGCVSIGRVRHPQTGRWTYRLTIVIAQKAREPLDRFHTRWNGTLFDYKRKGVTYWRWAVGGAVAQEALQELLPYLLLKRPIAELGIRFQIQMTAWNQQCGRTGYPEEIVLGREAFYQEARALNMKSRANPRAAAYAGPRAVNQ